MKKLIVLICALLMAVPAFGQATGFQRRSTTIDITLDSTDAETLHVGFPNNRGKGLLMAWMEVDSLKASTVIDSLSIQYRPAWAGFDTAAYGSTASGMTRANAIGKYAGWGVTASMGWSYAQIYKGPDSTAENVDGVLSDSLAPFRSAYSTTDSTFQDCRGGRIPLIFDMDGYPWRAMQVRIANTGGKTLTSSLSNDSIRVFIEFDWD
jgi:hypothetical protein